MTFSRESHLIFTSLILSFIEGVLNEHLTCDKKFICLTLTPHRLLNSLSRLPHTTLGNELDQLTKILSVTSWWPHAVRHLRKFMSIAYIGSVPITWQRGMFTSSVFYIFCEQKFGNIFFYTLGQKFTFYPTSVKCISSCDREATNSNLVLTDSNLVLTESNWDLTEL